MTLLLILVSLVFFSLITNVLPKYNKIFILISILIVFSFYFFISKNFFYIEKFYPKTNIQTYIPLGNYYNLLLKAFKAHNLYITDDKNFPLLKDPNIYEKYGNYAMQDNSMLSLLDTSLYKGKIYLYFGITPVLLFYCPFNFITNLYLTDKILVYVLSCLIFLISLFLIKKLSESIINIKEIPSNIIILSIFVVGLCNYIPFLLIRSFIYEVAITTAIFLLLFACCLFYYYVNSQNLLRQNVLNLCLSFALCLAVGARPHYVLFIPVFFFLIVESKYKESKNIKYTVYSALLFLIPCLIFGTVIALYNYFRFDSVFEFGWKYQLNDLKQYDYVLSLKDSLLAIKHNLFQFPNIDGSTIFSLVKTEGHRIGNEFIVGVIWSFPFVLLLLFVPKFLLDVFKKNKTIFYITILFLFVICVNFFVTSFIGMVGRYSFEYISFAVILSMILLYYLYNETKSRCLKKILNTSFVLIFIYVVFINISLLFCENNSLFYAPTSGDNYINVINFLFK